MHLLANRNIIYIIIYCYPGQLESIYKEADECLARFLHQILQNFSMSYANFNTRFYHFARFLLHDEKFCKGLQEIKSKIMQESGQFF